jgi:hypothetical protein
MPPMLPYEPVAELARLYDVLRDEGKTRSETIMPLAQKLGIPHLTVNRAITAAVALGLVPRWSMRAHAIRNLPVMITGYTDYLAERTAGRVEDVAMLWRRYYRPGACPAESNYADAIGLVAERMKLSTRTVERHKRTAIQLGLL